MKIDVKERILLTEILSTTEGSVTRLGAIRRMLDQVSLTAEELEEYSVISLPNGTIRWKMDVPQGKEIPFSTAQQNMISAVLSGASSLSAKHFPLLDLFGVKLQDPTEGQS
jgi:hypothetical protein